MMMMMMMTTITTTTTTTTTIYDEDDDDDIDATLPYTSLEQLEIQRECEQAPVVHEARGYRRTEHKSLYDSDKLTDDSRCLSSEESPNIGLGTDTARTRSRCWRGSIVKTRITQPSK